MEGCIEKHSKRISFIKSDLDRTRIDYTKLTQHEELKKYVETFANIDHVNKLKTVFLPKFEEFSVHIDKFYHRMEEMEIAVQTIDKSLGEKSRKSALKLLEQRIQNEYVQKKDIEAHQKKIDHTVDTTEKILAQVQSEFKTAQRVLETEIQDICDEQIILRFQKYEKIYSDFAEFFDSGNLLVQLDNKVDKSLLRLVNDQKVSKNEML